MWIKKRDEKNKTLTIAIPLTKGTDKTRIKRRIFLMNTGSLFRQKKMCFL